MLPRLLSFRLLSVLSPLALGLLFAGCDAGGSPKASADCKAPSCSETAQVGKSCENGANLTLGKYRVLNNLWGRNHTGVSGMQCAWSTCNTNEGISWGTDYSWFGGPNGQVTSYTAAILGWHFSTIPADSGLPLQLGNRTPINCNWSFKVKQTASSVQNVAYDIWLSDTPTPVGNTTPTDEVMIWLYGSGGAGPIGGSPVETVEIGGANFALSEGKNGGWSVHSFLRTGPQECSDLNLADFFEVLMDRYGVSPDKYVIGIEAGTEVFSGAGTLTTNHFSCDI